MSFAGWVLLGLGVTAVVGAIAWMLVGDYCLSLWPIVTMALGAGLLVAGGVTLAVSWSSDCEARGGHSVPSGPPYYVKAGSVMVPFQPTMCEVPS